MNSDEVLMNTNTFSPLVILFSALSTILL